MLGNCNTIYVHEYSKLGIMKSERIEYLDLAKAVSMILVIVGHCYWIKDFPIIHKTIYSFHMPLFFIISGFFAKELPLKKSLLKYSKSYLVPLFVTSLIALLLVIVGDLLRKDSILNTITSWGNLLLTMKGDQEELSITRITPLWFLMALFWGSVGFSQILKFNKSDSTIIVFGGLVFVSVLSCFVHLPLMIEEGILSLFFLWIGRLLYDYNLLSGKITNWGWLTILMIWIISIPCGPFFFKTISFGKLYVTIIGAVAATVILLNFFKRIECRINSGWIGKNTLSILCGHVISFNLLKMIGFDWARINTPPILLRFLIEAICMIAMALVLAWAISHIKPFKK